LGSVASTPDAGVRFQSFVDESEGERRVFRL
jgi:hypothetical protein